MDVVRKNNSLINRRRGTLLLISLFVVFLVYFLFLSSGGAKELARESTSIAEVRKGDLTVAVNGYGHLSSDKRKILTSLAGGLVEEIVLKPGAMVEPGSVILKLKNASVVQDVQSAKMALDRQKNELRQLRINNTRDLLEEKDRFSEVESELEIVKVNLEAESKLVVEGIVSQLNYKRTLITEKQLRKRIDVLHSRVEQLKELHQESVLSQLDVIKQHEELLQIQNSRLDSLTVKADMSGVLQHLPVELGQSVGEGEQLAVVGSTAELVALLRIPQTQISKINVGQKALIDTHQEKIEGTVRRIEPSVEEGSVTIEVALAYPLPSSARPELSVDGTIVIETLKNVLYVQRPVNTRTNTTRTIFKAHPQNDEAIQVAVTFGSGTERLIQILDGANVGDSLIISDTSSLNRFDTIRLIN